MHEADEPDVVFVRRLRLAMFIGVAEFERHWRQTVLVSVRMRVDAEVRRSGGYVSYEPVVEHLLALEATGRHVELIETIAESAARKALEDERVRRVEVTVEKPDIYAQAEGVGLTVVMHRPGA